MNYTVKRIASKAEIETCNRFDITHYMWNSQTMPKAYGWFGYIEGEGLFAKMVCEETNPKRDFKNHHDMVCQDSAMEIFLAFPEEGETLSNDSMYLNFEINANAAMYAKYGKGRKNRVFLTDKQYEDTGVTAVMEDDRWYLEVLFPEEVLLQVCDFESIKQGRAFYCNFYKIAEAENGQHFGAFSPIESEIPNFHLPVFFAEAHIE